MTLPSDSHPLAGRTVKLKSKGDPARGLVVDGAMFHVEDYWHAIGGRSWQNNTGNWACIHYANRVILAGLPQDDNVVYGKIGAFGHIVHVSELGEVVS